jgi:hypothetical protein
VIILPHIAASFVPKSSIRHNLKKVKMAIWYVFKKSIFSFLFLFFTIFSLKSQDTKQAYFFSGIGIINGQGTFGKSVEPSVGFNSGIELKFKKHFLAQLSVDFNSLKYNQKVLDNNSTLLFTNTNSTLLTIGANIGYNFTEPDAKWLLSTYVGSGYFNIGEPRATLVNNRTVLQSTVNQSSIFGRLGFRVGYKTPSAFFQTLYINAEYWSSPAVIQGGKANGVSFFVGTRMVIGK